MLSILFLVLFPKQDKKVLAASQLSATKNATLLKKTESLQPDPAGFSERSSKKREREREREGERRKRKRERELKKGIIKTEGIDYCDF